MPGMAFRRGIRRRGRHPAVRHIGGHSHHQNGIEEEQREHFSDVGTGLKIVGLELMQLSRAKSTASSSEAPGWACGQQQQVRGTWRKNRVRERFFCIVKQTGRPVESELPCTAGCGDFQGLWAPNSASRMTRMRASRDLPSRNQPRSGRLPQANRTDQPCAGRSALTILDHQVPIAYALSPLVRRTCVRTVERLDDRVVSVDREKLLICPR